MARLNPERVGSEGLYLQVIARAHKAWTDGQLGELLLLRSKGSGYPRGWEYLHFDRLLWRSYQAW